MIRTRHRRRGFALLFVFAMAAAMAVLLYRELPRVLFEGQREKEELLIFRGEQYKRAIQVFVRKHKKYPASMDELERFQDIRYLRRRYKDPLTGKDEWRLIHYENGGFPDSLVYNQGNPLDKEKSQADVFVAEIPSVGSQPAASGQAGAAIAGLQRRGSDRPAAVAGSPSMEGPGLPFDPNAPPPPADDPQDASPGSRVFAPGGSFPPGQPYDPQPQMVGAQPVFGQQPQPSANPVPFLPGASPGSPTVFPIGQQPGQPAPVPFVPGQTNPFQPQPQQQPSSGGFIGGGNQPFIGGSASPQAQQPYQPYQPQPFPIQQQPFPQQQPQPFPQQQPQPFPQQPYMPPGGVQQPYQPYVPIQPAPASRPGAANPQPAAIPGARAPISSQTGGAYPTPVPNPGRPGGPQQPGGTGGAPNQALDLIRQILTTPRPGGMPGAPQGAQAGLGAGIAGVATTVDAEGIMVYAEKTNYKEWEFIYDPSQDKSAQMAAGGQGVAQPGAAGEPGKQGAGQPGVPGFGPQMPGTGFGPGQPAFGQPPVGQPPFGQAPFGQGPFGQQPGGAGQPGAGQPRGRPQPGAGQQPQQQPQQPPPFIGGPRRP